MDHIPARSPGLRLARNLSLLWMAGSLLGLLGVLGLVVYAMGWGCSNSNTSGGLSWGPCVLAHSVFVFGAVASLIVSVIALFFAQLFFMAGAEVRQVTFRRCKLFSRESLLDNALDAVHIID